MSLDLCISYSIGAIKAVKFSDYLSDLGEVKDPLKVTYDTFLKHRFYCPEIARMREKKGVRFRYKEDNFFINATIFFDNPDKIYYVWGNSHSNDETSSPLTPECITKFIQMVRKKNA